MKRYLLFLILIFLIPYFIIIQIEEKKEEQKEEKKETIRVKRVDKNIVEEIPLEEYVIGVVSSEVPALFEFESLKAMSVAARTYALKRRNLQNEDYDVVDTVDNQVYKDISQLKEKWEDKFDEYYNRISKAVKETQNEYMTYEGEIIDALYFSTSTGFTENSEEVFKEYKPYLRSVESPFDSDVPSQFGQTKISKQEFLDKLGLKNQDIIKIDIIEKTSHDRVKKIRINEKEFTGDEIRNIFSLKSTYFKIDINSSEVTITTKGYGHGVGMSQYGTNGMAKQGYTYDQILKYYYTGIEISKL